jgi:thioesterase domain-containing protein
LLVIIDLRRPNIDPNVAWSIDSTLRFLWNLPNVFYDEFLACDVRTACFRAKYHGRAILKRLLEGVRRRSGAARESGEDRLGLTVSSEDFEHFVSASDQGLRDYLPQPYPGRVLLLKARSQPLWRWHEPMMGWRDLLTGPCEMRAIPGSHLRLFDESYVGAVGRVMREALRRAQDAHHGSGTPAPRSVSAGSSPR